MIILDHLGSFAFIKFLIKFTNPWSTWTIIFQIQFKALKLLKSITNQRVHLLSSKLKGSTTEIYWRPFIFYVGYRLYNRADLTCLERGNLDEGQLCNQTPSSGAHRSVCPQLQPDWTQSPRLSHSWEKFHIYVKISNAEYVSTIFSIFILVVSRSCIGNPPTAPIP